MKQKEYIIKVCGMLEDEFPLFRAIKVMIEHSTVDESVINALIEVFDLSMEQAKDSSQLASLKESILQMQSLDK